MNKRKEVNRTLLQVRNMANGSKLHWDIDQIIVDQIQEMVTIIRNMFGVNVSKSVLARRALQAYHSVLRDLVRNGSNPRFKSSQKKLLNYMASVESERMALFQAANKPQDVGNPKFGGAAHGQGANRSRP